MRQWTGSLLLQIMVYRIFCTKPLHEPLFTNCHFCEILSKIQTCIMKETHLKISSAKRWQFRPDPIILKSGNTWPGYDNAAVEEQDNTEETSSHAALLSSLIKISEPQWPVPNFDGNEIGTMIEFIWISWHLLDVFMLYVCCFAFNKQHEWLIQFCILVHFLFCVHFCMGPLCLNKLVNWIKLHTYLVKNRSNSPNNKMLLFPCVPAYNDTMLCVVLLSNSRVSFAHGFVLVC